MSEKIGIIPCILCGHEVPVTEQKNGKSMVNCGWCGCQIYTRSLQSDSLLRKLMAAAPPAAKPKSIHVFVAEDDAPKPKPAAQYDAAGRRIAS